MRLRLCTLIENELVEDFLSDHGLPEERVVALLRTAEAVAGLGDQESICSMVVEASGYVGRAPNTVLDVLLPHANPTVLRNAHLVHCIERLNWVMLEYLCPQADATQAVEHVLQTLLNQNTDPGRIRGGALVQLDRFVGRVDPAVLVDFLCASPSVGNAGPWPERWLGVLPEPEQEEVVQATSIEGHVATAARARLGLRRAVVAPHHIIKPRVM